MAYRRIRSEAILLRLVDFGESDRIVHLLCPEVGRLTAIAKGARRSVKRFGGSLDLCNLLRVQVEKRRPTSMARIDPSEQAMPLVSRMRMSGCFPCSRIHPFRPSMRLSSRLFAHGHRKRISGC